MKKKLLFLIPLFLILTQCKKDDDDPEYVIREYSEQVNVDHQLLEDYLRTHTFNYEDFVNQINVDVKIDTLTDFNSSRQSLYDLANVKTINVTDTNGDNVSHNLYYIIAREGLNEKPSVADSVYIAYDGLLTDGTAFTTSSGGLFYQSVESANEYDVLVAALNQLALVNYQADTILLNPTDLHKIVLLKSTANEYLRQQIYTGIQPTIMGIPVTINTAMPNGKFLVGNLAQATQLWIRENLAISFSREDSTNFRDGFVTVKAQERVALTNYLPNAIVQGTFSTAKTALETS